MQVEFLGVPRQRAGVSVFDSDAATLGELMGALAARFPTLSALIEHDRLHPSLAANLNGDRFVNDPATPLAATDCLLILSADVGG